MNAPQSLTAPSTSPLTIDQLAAFHRDGCVCVPGFFSSREVAALQAEVAQLQAAGKLRNVATDGDGTTHSTSAFNLQLCPAHPHSRLILGLPFQTKVVAAISSLIGDPAIWYLDQIFLKPARHGAGTGWHTDNAYFQSQEVERGTGMWIAVHDATVANGTMAVIPGSHRQPLPHRRDGGSDHHITCVDHVREADAVLCELPAGGVVFFNWGIAHRTGGNATDRDRAGLAYHFVNQAALPPIEVRTKNSLNYRDPLPTMTGPAADHGARRFGEDLRGLFDAEVARLTAGS